MRWQQLLSQAIGLLLCLGIPLDAQPIVQRSESSCDTEAFLTAKHRLVEIHPEAVILKPWLGQHHVYGIFMLPKSIQSRDPVVLKVKDVVVDCGIVNRSGTKREGVLAKPGHFLMVEHIQTRTALWTMLQGKADHLKNPKNWVLVYIQS